MQAKYNDESRNRDAESSEDDIINPDDPSPRVPESIVNIALDVA